jgi:F-type H+-transporting ATPase subunit delta
MAEPSTIARPYAAALFQASRPEEAARLVDQLDGVAALAADPGLLTFASSPKVEGQQVYALMADLAGRDGVELDVKLRHLVATAIDNGRLAVLPEIAAQYRDLVNERSGVAEAHVTSAFPLEPQQLDALVAVLQKRFGRTLKADVTVDPSLIGGVRVAVGDEVLDTSVRARLEQMRVALTH